MTVAEARDLFAYTRWANARFTAALSALAPDELTREITSSFPSLLATYAHLVSAEWIWLQRWLGQAPDGVPAWVASPGFEDVKARLEAIEAERAGFVAGLRDADLEEECAYRLLNGEARSTRFGDLFRHVVNHGAFHRGQLVTMLRQLGHKPPSTDYILYVREYRQ